MIGYVKDFSTKFQIASVILAVVLSLTHPNASHAQVIFEFVEDYGFSNNRIATLELTNLPVTSPDQVLRLTFTEVGESLFGLGKTYPGTFDATNGSLTLEIDPDGFLANTETGPGAGSSIYDLVDVPNSAIYGELNSFTLSFEFIDAGARFSYMQVSNGFDPFVSLQGRWVLVPEPAALSSGLSTIILCLSRRRNVSHFVR